MCARSTVPVMLNQDLLYAIFEHFAAPDHSWYQYQRVVIPGEVCSPQERDEAIRRTTLAACVRVCRAFFGPAASVLWRDLDNLGPALVLNEGTTSDALQSKCPPTSSLARRHRYFSLIRAVHCLQGPGGGVPGVPPAFSASSAGADTGYALRLTKLRWVQVVPGNTDLFTLLNFSLQSLHIIIRYPGSSHCDNANADKAFIETLVVRAAERAPNLIYLRISSTSGIPNSWLVPIRGFAQVETIDLLEPEYHPVSTSTLLQPLTTLQHLSKLKLRLQSTSGIAALGVEGGFGALRELHLNGKLASLQDVTDRLRSVSSPHLRSLRIDDCECRTKVFSDVLYDLCAVLHSKFAGALEVLVLSVYGIGPSVTLERPLLEYLHPLLRIRGMTDVRLSLAPNRVVVALAEADVMAMAGSWPLLEQLHMDCALSGSGGGVGLPRGVLERLTRTCPLLEDIRLPIEAESEGDASADAAWAYYAGSYSYGQTEPFLCPCLCGA